MISIIYYLIVHAASRGRSLYIFMGLGMGALIPDGCLRSSYGTTGRVGGGWKTKRVAGPVFGEKVSFK